MYKFIFIFIAATSLSGCMEDDNAEPIYGKESGLPVNCRAYVQAAIDGYRGKVYSTNDAMNGLERNCGKDGHAWKSNR